MAKEIERKFLLKAGTSIPIPDEFAKMKIKQAYIFTEMGKHLRVRIINKKAILCLKFTEDFIRDEFEYEIPLADAKVMYEKSDLTIEKNRLSFDSDGVHYDVDSYVNGFVFVEVEFESIKDMNNWVPPSWIGEEITGDEKYSNISLAKKN
jgi:adenylate cyclase